jgi:hypothetical protein
LGKTIISAPQRARIIICRGRMSASEAGQKEGCSRDNVLKIWNRHARKTGAPKLPQMFKTSVLTGQVLRNPKPPEPLPPEPLIDHGFRLLELSDHQCSWPLHGRDADDGLRFCGAPRQENPSRLTTFYCEFHAAKVTSNGNEAEPDVPGPRPDDILLEEAA